MPSVFSISHEASFVDELARGLLERWGSNPLELGSALILLPTRRACRSLQHAFLRASGGKSLILPQLVPLGDLDEEELLFGDGLSFGEVYGENLPPAISALRRQLLLSHPVRQWAQTQGESLPDDQAIRLAGELGRLLDQVETEGVSLDRLADLVPEDYAEHWQLTLKFLEILTHYWPEIQKDTGGMGGKERRRLLLEAQARQWRETPPACPVIVAGSTGSIPAAAAVIAEVARLPKGEVILPGLDFDASEEAWQAITLDPSHPQHGLARLLLRLGLEREDVGLWVPAATAGLFPDKSLSARASLIHMALRPARKTTDWSAFLEQKSERDFAQALQDVERIDCPGLAEEALSIALILRGVLEDPDKTAALITPDQNLARRVAAELRRWDLEIDNSAGHPLPETAPAVFLRLCAEAVVSGFAPVPFLALLKHPLAACGMAPGRFRRLVRMLEKQCLRGVRPAAGLQSLREELEQRREKEQEEADDLLELLVRLSGLSEAFSTVLDQPSSTLEDLLVAHISFAEGLASAEDQPGADRLWLGESGSAVADFVSDLLESSDDAPELNSRNYPDVFAALMVGRAVRQRYGLHPRLAILGTIEARMQHADVVVLGGLNEGTWPGEVKPGPWMSRPMRKDFGLPQPEQAIGLSAQDFLQAFCAPKVYLTRSEKVEGTPTVPSRWLLRLEALLKGKGCLDLLFSEGNGKAGDWLNWAAELDKPEKRNQIGAPAPCPPVAARPRKLSVTRIETWMRDPYALYADKILNLKKLDPLDADPSAAEKGSYIHEALERFVEERAIEGEDPLGRLIGIGEEVFEPVRNRPALWSFWWPRFVRIAEWFVEQEQQRRLSLSGSLVEVTGAMTLEGPAGDFVLTAKADRLDLRAEGGVEILDYKTGTPPSSSAVLSGFAPQLPLEAALMREGAFRSKEGDAVFPDEVFDLQYWKLSGGEPAGKISRALGSRSKKSVSEVAQEALEGLQALIAAFDDPATVYRARPRAAHALRYNDYEHLARIREWSVGGEEGE
ncbi:double-strand break repair protein AddB [Kiloniella sp. b19]|uniref:double-strand break repair protein AddB n=1 Tax=Kiloniella sp. GXU_MW_B19 TaxID=3141326 RepID=UPI0031D60E84